MSTAGVDGASVFEVGSTGDWSFEEVEEAMAVEGTDVDVAAPPPNRSVIFSGPVAAGEATGDGSEDCRFAPPSLSLTFGCGCARDTGDVFCRSLKRRWGAEKNMSQQVR